LFFVCSAFCFLFLFIVINNISWICLERNEEKKEDKKPSKKTKFVGTFRRNNIMSW
jgi:Na+-transporting methylmalonyl-CoA/oxaloacetate decarboxylase gamma subunit